MLPVPVLITDAVTPALRAVIAAANPFRLFWPVPVRSIFGETAWPLITSCIVPVVETAVVLALAYPFLVLTDAVAASDVTFVIA